MFCLHTAVSHEHYDPLDTAQWRFYVAARSTVEARGGRQMGLAALAKVAGDPVAYSDLRATIAMVHQE